MKDIKKARQIYFDRLNYNIQKNKHPLFQNALIKRKADLSFRSVLGLFKNFQVRKSKLTIIGKNSPRISVYFINTVRKCYFIININDAN